MTKGPGNAENPWSRAFWLYLTEAQLRSKQDKRETVGSETEKPMALQVQVRMASSGVHFSVSLGL